MNDAEREGYYAYLDGIAVIDNPYDNDIDLENHAAWEEGWYMAAWDD